MIKHLQQARSGNGKVVWMSKHDSFSRYCEASFIIIREFVLLSGLPMFFLLTSQFHI